MNNVNCEGCKCLKCYSSLKQGESTDCHNCDMCCNGNLKKSIIIVKGYVEDNEIEENITESNRLSSLIRKRKVSKVQDLARVKKKFEIALSFYELQAAAGAENISIDISGVDYSSRKEIKKALKIPLTSVSVCAGES